MKRIAVTGAAGNIAYALLFRLAAGDLCQEPLILHLLETESMMRSLEGVKMELEDGAFPFLKEVIISSDPKKVFEKADMAFLIGAKPRTKGMERSDLLKENGAIFKAQGEALHLMAPSSIKVLVIGNPCNTNCWIAMKQAPRIPKENFHAMTRLDHNRALGLLAKESGVGVDQVKGVTIWGNHSTTQVPDYSHATIEGQLAEKRIEKQWLDEVFVPAVQNRGAAIIEARGVSSAASAASSAIDAMRSLVTPTKEGEWYSSAMLSNGNPYGIASDIVYSFPLKTTKEGKVEFFPDLTISESVMKKMKISEKELLDEVKSGF